MDLGRNEVSNVIEFSQRQPILRALATADNMDAVGPYVFARLKLWLRSARRWASRSGRLSGRPSRASRTDPHLHPPLDIALMPFCCPPRAVQRRPRRPGYRRAHSPVARTSFGRCCGPQRSIPGVACGLWISSALNAMVIWLLSRRVGRFKLSWRPIKHSRTSVRSPNLDCLQSRVLRRCSRWQLVVPDGVWRPGPIGGRPLCSLLPRPKPDADTSRRP